MPRRQPVIQLPPAAAIVLFLCFAVALVGYAAAQGEWLRAGVDSAMAVFLTYLMIRRMRAPKGTRMALLSKGDIFAADDRKYEDVEVPEWANASGDCTVRLRGLTGTERDAYEASTQKLVNGKPVQDLRNFRARLVQLSAIDEHGAPLFDQSEIPALARRSSAAISRLFDVACKLSGITEEDVEALEGNSEPAQSGPPISDSPSPTDSPSMSSSPVSAPVASPNTWPTNGSTGHSVPSGSTISPR